MLLSFRTASCYGISTCDSSPGFVYSTSSLFWTGTHTQHTVKDNTDRNRTNIGNAKVAGLQEDLNITDTQYNIALTVFFISYSVFEPLTNVLLKRWGPSIFIPVIVILWVSTSYCLPDTLQLS